MTIEKSATPWYRHPIMWLVIAPPVGAVIAGIITFVLILKHPDPVISTQRPSPAALHGASANSVMPPTE